MAASLGEMVAETADRFGDAIAFQVRRGFRIERISFREVGERARAVAGWLSANDVQPGERILVWSPNMPEYAVLYFGAWMAGCVVVPIDVRTQPEVLDRIIAAATPVIGFKSRFLEAHFGPPVRASYDLEDLFALIAGAAPLAPPRSVTPDDLCEIAFTSGTTGSPKGVMLTHGNLLAELRALQTAFPLQQRYRALSLLPLSHSLEQAINLLLTFSSAVPITYVPRVNGATIVRALREERITCLIAVPELLRVILGGLERRAQQEGTWKRYQLGHRIAGRLPFPARRLLFHKVHVALGGHLEFFGCGGARLDVKLAEAWERMGIRIFEGYGLTETSAAASLNTRQAKRLGTVGRPLPGVEARIAEDGEILLRGPTVSRGYWDDPERTANVIVDGWFHTGDVGRLDDGFLTITGRDAFKLVLPDGRNVYPEDVERVLNLHPLVTESCVVGVSRHGDESVHAVLVTPAPERADEIIRDANSQLADQQQIRGHSVWTEPDFPRTPILKIDRRQVRSVVESQVTGAPSTPAPASDGKAPSAADPLGALIARIAEREVPGDAAQLGSDLDLDSIGRVELLAAIEEELGRIVDELRVGPQTTVGDLRALVAAAATSSPPASHPTWPRSPGAVIARSALQSALFRLQDRWLRFEIVHPERAAALPTPSILIYNYQGPYAALAVLRALPPRVRKRTVIAADARLWEGSGRWQGSLAALAVQAFPFTKSGGAVRPSLEELGRWLDDGYAVIMTPEGNPERNGEMLPFLGGTGLMAVEMAVPVIPFRLEDYHQLFPDEQTFPFLPNRRGRVRVIVGEPVRLARTTPYDEATRQLEKALIDTR